VAELSLAIKPNPLGGGSLLVNAVHGALLTDCGCCDSPPTCLCGKDTPFTFTLDFVVTTKWSNGETEYSGTIECSQKNGVWTGSIDASEFVPDPSSYPPDVTISNPRFVGTATCNNEPQIDWVAEVTRPGFGTNTETLKLIGLGKAGVFSPNYTPGPHLWVDSAPCFDDLRTICGGQVTITPGDEKIPCPDRSCDTCKPISLTLDFGDGQPICFILGRSSICIWFRPGTGQGSTGDGWTIRLDKELNDTGDPIWVLDVDSSIREPLGHLTAHADAPGEPACPQDASGWTIDGNTFANTPTITIHEYNDRPADGETTIPCDCPVDCSHCCEVYAIEFSGTCSAPGTPVTRNFTRTSSCSWQSDTGDTLHCTGKKWIITASLGAGTYHFEADVDGPCPPQNAFARVGNCTSNADIGVIAMACAPATCATDCSACDVLANALSITQSGTGQPGYDDSMQVDAPGVCPMQATNGQLDATLECPDGDVWVLIVFTDSAGPTGPHIRYEEPPEADGCPPAVFDTVVENTVIGSNPNPTATIDV
jgi:hypothetical protein